MKKLLIVVFALCLTTIYTSCTEEALNEGNEQSTEIGDQACPAPDTNCNGIPDHEE